MAAASLAASVSSAPGAPRNKIGIWKGASSLQIPVEHTSVSRRGRGRVMAIDGAITRARGDDEAEVRQPLKHLARKRGARALP